MVDLPRYNGAMPMDFEQIDQEAMGFDWWGRNGHLVTGGDESSARTAVFVQQGDRVVAMLVPIDPPLDVAHAAGLLGGIEAARRSMPTPDPLQTSLSTGNLDEPAGT